MTRLAKLLPALAATIVIAAAAAAGAAGSSTPSSPASVSVANVIALITGSNTGLKSYRAHASLDVRQLNFPWLHPVLDGTEYYGQPGFTVLDFPHTPSYLKGITKVEGTVFSAHRWEHCYNITMTTLPEAYVLHMVP